MTLVRGGTEGSRQGLAYVVGVSKDACGSSGLSLSYVVVPPGGVSEPHYHDGYETAIYQLAGRAETSFGPRLEEQLVTEAGDFLFIPPGVPHCTRNLSDTEPVRAIIARNDASDEERVVPYEPDSGSSRKRAPGTGLS